MNEFLKSDLSIEKFHLWRFLIADLRRAQKIKLSQHGEISSLRLCLGFFSPRFMPILLCRLAHWFYQIRLTPIAKLFSLLNFFLFGIEIAVRCPIGRGLYLPHTQGTVIGAQSIGKNATIFQGVTLGALEVDFAYTDSTRPTVANDVILGSGAKILGGIFLGDGSRVGANAVVLDSVPPGALAVGVPARVIIE